jgi:tellurite resistance protein
MSDQLSRASALGSVDTQGQAALIVPGRLIQAPLAQRAPPARSMMTIRYTPLNTAISQRTPRDLSEEKIMQGLVTAGALVALSDGEVKTIECAELVNFVDQQGFVSTISRVEIAETFKSRVRELEDRYCANVLLENLRPLIGQSLGSVVVRIAQKVAAADREIHPGELRALKLLRQIMANLPAVRTTARV